MGCSTSASELGKDELTNEATAGPEHSLWRW